MEVWGRLLLGAGLPDQAGGGEAAVSERSGVQPGVVGDVRIRDISHGEKHIGQQLVQLPVLLQPHRRTGDSRVHRPRAGGLAPHDRV